MDGVIAVRCNKTKTIVSGASIDFIVSGAPPNCIGTCPRQKTIGTITAKHQVGVSSSEKPVISGCPKEGIVAV